MAEPPLLSEKLKKALSQKISEYDDLCEERDEIEEDMGLSYLELREEANKDNSDAVFQDYSYAIWKIAKLEEEIYELLMEAKCYPLMGLAENEIKEIQPFLHTGVDRYLDDYLAQKLTKIDALNWHRVKKLHNLFLSTYLDAQERSVYREIIECFIYGNFFASSVLCRSLSEHLAKKLIIFRNLGDYITNEESNRKRKSIPSILDEYHLVPENVIKMYVDLYKEASDLIHMKKEVFQKDSNLENKTLDQIHKLQLLVKSFTNPSKKE